MTPPPPPRPPQLGPLLARRRLARGWSQQRTAAELCAAAGVATLSRHEISRWEQRRRVPRGFWLGWLAVVLDVPLVVLAEAAADARRAGRARVTRSGRVTRTPVPSSARTGPGRAGGRAGTTTRGGEARHPATG